MGVTVIPSTIPGGRTPICSACGVALCWDISEHEYLGATGFWDDWICRDCNGDQPLSLKEYRQKRGSSGEERHD
ncbi:hypothetical protein [Azospirillum sp. B4]|uniref:hypothetical protein n=1 Tax=Azospirillum sp. B4 TaxID=95605 RepID=UPI0003460DF2|nr:hypothetical protein [Azospirillum sp. B4]